MAKNPDVPQAKAFSDGKHLATLKTTEEINSYLESFPVWRLRDLALYLGVDEMFYRRTLLSIPTHPTAIDPNAGNLAWWSSEMVAWFSDPAKMKHKAA
jgi:hypothetical protein